MVGRVVLTTLMVRRVTIHTPYPVILKIMSNADYIHRASSCLSSPLWRQLMDRSQFLRSADRAGDAPVDARWFLFVHDQLVLV